MLIETLINAALKKIDKSLDALGRGLVAAYDRIAKKQSGDFDKSIDKQTSSLNTLARRLEAAIGQMKEPTFSGEIEVDTEDMVSEIEKITEEIRDLATSIKESAPDMEPLERGIQMLLNKIEEFSDGNIIEALDALRSTLEAQGKKAKEQQTFKLEEQQFRALRNNGRGGGGMSTAGPLQARGITHANLSMPLVATEYTYTFPANTVTWVIKLRDQGTLLYYAFATGTLPNSGTGAKYSTAPAGFIRAQEGVEWGGRTIYLGAESADMIAEIEAYTAK